MGHQWDEEDLNKLLRNRPDLSILNEDKESPDNAVKQQQPIVGGPLPPLTPHPEKKAGQLWHEYKENRAPTNESGEQMALFNWKLRNVAEFPVLETFISYPIGGKRHKTTARKMKAEGASAGFPDTFGTYQNQFYYGLGMELKVGYNKPTELQEQWLNRLANQGWFTCVVWSYETAKIIVQWFYNLPMQGVLL